MVVHPVGYAPDGYMEIDGILLPVYLTQVVTGKGGMVTIDADNMKRTIPAGYYDVMYSSKTPPVVGMLRVIEITESEESSVKIFPLFNDGRGDFCIYS